MMLMVVYNNSNNNRNRNYIGDINNNVYTNKL